MGIKSTYAAKVGFWVVLATFVTVSLLSYFGVITIYGKRRNEYYLHFHFATIQGLNKGAKFKINGNEVGVVERTEISPASGVDVMVKIYDTKYVLHENAKVVITKESILGSSYIDASEPAGAYYDRSIHGKEGYFYIQTPRGKSKTGDFLYFTRADLSKVIGVIEDMQPGDPGYEKSTVRILDDIVKLGPRYAFVPSSAEIQNPVTKLIERKTHINVFAPLEPNSYFEGTREAGPEDLIVHLDEVVLQTGVKVDQLTNETRKVIQQVQSLLDELSGIIDKTTIDNLVGSLRIQIEKIGLNMDKMAVELESLISENEPKITATVDNIEATSKSIKDLVSDPELNASVKDLINRLGDIATKIETILGDIEEITSDPSIKSDIKEGIHSASGAMKDVETSVNEMKDKIDLLSEMEITGRIKSRYRPKPDTYFSDIDFYLRLPERGNFLTMGIDEIGEGDFINAQIGYSMNEKLDTKIGIKKSKIGVGADYHLDRFFLNVDLYDPNEIVLDAYAGLGLNDDFYVIVGGENLFEDDIFNLGLMYKF